MADVTRVEPAIAQGARCFFRRFPVAPHDLWAADDDLSIFSRRQFVLARFDINNLLLSVMDGHADAIDTHQRGVTGLRVRERGCLGHTISLDNADACLILQFACRIKRQGGRA